MHQMDIYNFMCNSDYGTVGRAALNCCAEIHVCIYMFIILLCCLYSSLINDIPLLVENVVHNIYIPNTHVYTCVCVCVSCVYNYI